MGFLEGAAQPFVRVLVVALEVDASDLDLVLAVDDERDVDHLLAHRVVVDAHVDLGVAEPLFGPVGLDELLVLVDHVVGELAAAAQLQLLEQVLLLALRHPFEAPVIDAGTLLEEDVQVEAVALDLRADLHVGEEALAPKARDGRSDEVARQIDRVAGDEARRRFEHVVVQILHPVHVDVADVVEFLPPVLAHHGRLFREGGFRDRRAVRAAGLLGRYFRAAQHQYGCGRRPYLTEIVHLFQCFNSSSIVSPDRNGGRGARTPPRRGRTPPP